MALVDTTVVQSLVSSAGGTRGRECVYGACHSVAWSVRRGVGWVGWVGGLCSPMVHVINGSECVRDRPGFGCDIVYQVSSFKYYKFRTIQCFIMFYNVCSFKLYFLENSHYENLKRYH